MEESHSYSIRDDTYEYIIECHPSDPDLITQCSIISINSDIEKAPAISATALDKIKSAGAISLENTFRKHHRLIDVWDFFSSLYYNDLTRIVSTSCMFQDCGKLTDLRPLSLLSTSYLMDTSLMFSWCFKIRDVSPLAQWDVSHVRNMHGMFLNCTALHDISPLTNWNARNVKKKRYMFCNCNITLGKEILENLK